MHKTYAQFMFGDFFLNFWLHRPKEDKDHRTPSYNVRSLKNVSSVFNEDKGCFIISVTTAVVTPQKITFGNRININRES